MRSRTRKTTEVLAVSEHELLAETRDLAALHGDVAMPAMRSSVQEWIEQRAATVTQSGRLSRRGLLLGSGAVALGGIVMAACSSSTTTPPTTGATTTKNPKSLTGTLKVAGLAASLENLGIFAYKSGIAAAKAGKLGKVPPAIVTFATTAMKQHMDHAAAWNAVITAAGKAAVTETDPALTPTVKSAFGKVTTVAGLAKLALLIEDIAGQTYQSAAAVLSTSKAIQTAASIQPVEMQHAAILNLALGMYPVPNAFNPIATARSTSDLGA